MEVDEYYDLPDQVRSPLRSPAPMAHRGYLSNGGGRYDSQPAAGSRYDSPAAAGHYEHRDTEEVRYSYDRTRGGEGRYERTAGEEHTRTETRRRTGGEQNGTERPRSNSDTGKYQEYPPDRPFINDDYRRDPNKPVKAFPESNRQDDRRAERNEAVMSALKGLQDKIRHLELERSAAEDNLRTLATETSRFREILQPDDTTSSPPDRSYMSPTRAAGANLTMQNNDVHEKLTAAEQRCQLLERQLDHMRKLVQGAESKASHAATRSQLLKQQHQEEDEADIRARLKKINELEREHLKLTATQAIAENKIRELEHKVRDERIHRRKMQEKAAELETAAQSQRILMSSAESQPPVRKTKKKTRKRTVTGKAVKRPSSAPPRRRTGEPNEHFRLNMARIPFVAGQSTTPSHSVPANFQNVLSLMKAHNPILCKSPRQHQHNGHWNQVAAHTVALRGSNGASDGISTGSSGIGSGTGGSTGVSTGVSRKSRIGGKCSDIAEILLQLQDEFGALSFEHSELSQQIAECSASNPRLRDDLERELEALVDRMEDKGNQIACLRRHQNKLLEKEEKKRRKKTQVSEYNRGERIPHQVAGEVEVTTTIRTKGKNVTAIRPCSAPHYTAQGGSKAQASLNMLKDLKKIQTTLRKDDLSWDD